MFVFQDNTVCPVYSHLYSKYITHSFANRPLCCFSLAETSSFLKLEKSKKMMLSWLPRATRERERESSKWWFKQEV